MEIEYLKKNVESVKQTELTFMEYFDDFYFNESYAIQMKKKWYSLTRIAKIYSYSNSITITLTEENFKELKERLQKFEDDTKIKVNVEVK